jgi:DNA replication protein DnaC
MAWCVPLKNKPPAPPLCALGFDERFSLVVQRQVSWRDERRVARLLKAAKLKVSSACVQDIDWRASRSLDRSLMTALAGGDWLRHAQNLLITGATGCGKTWLACAWGLGSNGT